MNVYLVQHAKALSKEENPDRPLSEEGRLELERMAEFLAAQPDVVIGRIWNSGKTRAAQTAELLADRLNPPLGVRSAEGLSPMDKPQIWAERVKEMSQDVMLVGHLPHLDRLSSLLLTGDPDRGVIAFQNAGVVRLRSEEGSWSLTWVVTPDLAI